MCNNSAHWIQHQCQPATILQICSSRARGPFVFKRLQNSHNEGWDVERRPASSNLTSYQSDENGSERPQDMRTHVWQCVLLSIHRPPMGPAGCSQKGLWLLLNHTVCGILNQTTSNQLLTSKWILISAQIIVPLAIVTQQHAATPGHPSGCWRAQFVHVG